MLNIYLSFGAADYNQLSFQTSASPLAESIVELHHYIWIFCAFIFGFVLWMLFISMYYFNINFNEWYFYKNEKFFNLESNLYNGFKNVTISSNTKFDFVSLPVWVKEAFYSYYLCKKANINNSEMSLLDILYNKYIWIKIQIIYYIYFNSNYMLANFNCFKYNLFLNNWQLGNNKVLELNILKFEDYLNQIEIYLAANNYFNNNWINFDNEDIEFQTRTRVNHGEGLEILWTLFPGIVLFFIAVPSFYILYSVDDIIDPSIFIKVIGHQWYWSYEFINIDSYDNISVNLTKYNYDSYLKTDLEKGQLRLLEVDNPLFVPIWAHICFLVTSADVLHSWAVPSLGIKIDAVPGRLNQTQCYILKEGYYYGQCSELCGVNHGFMPILVIGKTLQSYDIV